MPNVVRNPYSNTAGNTPSSLGNGVLAVNQADGKLFYRSSAGVVTALATGGGSGSVDVYEFATTANFPATGSTAVIYIATDTARMYRWVGTAYMEMGPIGGNVDTALRDLLAPPAPTSVTATAGNASATVSWTAPTGVLAQAPVTDYVVQVSSNSGSSWTTFSDGSSTATSATVTGLTNGTAVQFRVAAVNSVGAGAYSTASTAVTPVVGDALWANVQLLLPGDTSVNDASRYSRSVTASGGAASSSSQSKWGGGSISINSGQYLTVPSIAFGSGDFVIECWLYFTSISGAYTGIYDARPSSNGAQPTLILNGSSVAWFTNAGFQITGSSLSTGQWHHVAVARASGNTRMYVNGTQAGSTYSDSTNYASSSSPLIGKLFDGYAMDGFIDDLRITVGSARSMTGATITVPTAAFPTRGIYEDPFFESVSLLLPMDGAGATFADSSLTPKTITAVGNATQSTAQSKWGGKSAYFTGTSRLSASTSSAFSFGTGDFCVEMWVYPSGTSAFQTLFSTRSSDTGEDSSNVFFGFNTGTLTPIVYTNGLVLSGSSSLSAGTWSHIAFVRESGVVSIYLNGSRIGNTSFTTSITGTNASVGLTQNNEHQFSGYIDDVRVTSGSNRGYAGATITAPTAAFPTS